MEKTAYRIRRQTAEEISNAIKTYHAKRNNIILGKIPIREWANVLRNGAVTKTAPEATEEELVIFIKTLTDLADVVRSIGGTTNKIDVIKLAYTIINLREPLKAPTIELLKATITGIEEPKPTKLGTPRVDISIIRLGEEGTDVTQLDAPEIEVLDVIVTVQENVPIVKQLNAPLIELVDLSFGLTEEPIVKQLDTPNIYLDRVNFEDEEDIVNTPAILGIAILGNTILGDANVIQLKEPNIELVIVEVEDKEDSKPTVNKLDKPIIELVNISREDIGEDEGDITLQLGTPIIDIFDVNKVIEEIKPTSKKLYSPQIDILTINNDVSDDGSEIEKLDEPEIELVNINKEIEDVIPNVEKLNKPTIQILRFNVEAEEPKPNVYQLDKPIIECVTVNVEDSGEEIVPIQLDKPIIELVEAIKEIEEEPTSTRLFTPTIEIGTVILLDTPAILGMAILGNTILGYKTEEQIEKIETPNIDIFDIEFEVDGEIVRQKLSKPSVEILNINKKSDESADKPTKLTNPTIVLNDVNAQIEEDSTVNQLNYPDISIVDINVDVETPNDYPTILTSPSVEIIGISVEMDEDSIVKKLDEPVIYMAEIKDLVIEEDETKINLDKPSIILENVDYTEESVTNRLDAPTINIFNIGYGTTKSILGIAILGNTILGSNY